MKFFIFPSQSEIKTFGTTSLDKDAFGVGIDTIGYQDFLSEPVSFYLKKKGKSFGTL